MLTSRILLQLLRSCRILHRSCQLKWTSSDMDDLSQHLGGMHSKVSPVIFASKQGGIVLDDYVKLGVIVAEAGEKRPAFVQQQHEPMQRKAFFSKAVLLRLVVLMIFVFMLGTLCSRRPSEIRFEGRTIRRLAESPEESLSDDELHGILEACVDYDVELGRLPTVTEQQTTKPRRPSTQKALLVAFMEGIASSAHSPSDPSTSSSPEEQTSRSSLTELMSLEPPIQHFQQPFVAATHEDLSTQPTTSGVAVAEELEEEEFLASLRPGAWLDDIGNIIDEEEEEEAEIEVSPLPDQPTSDDGGQSLPTGGEVPQLPSTSATVDYGWDVNNHPFVRLPRVPPEALKEGLQSQSLKRPFVRWNASSEMLRVVHDLYLKEELDSKDVWLLAFTHERLVRVSMLREPNQLLSPHLSSKLRQMGLSFLTLDAVLCSCQLLRIPTTGEKWWVDFAEVFRTDYELPEPFQSVEVKVRENHKLAKRLVVALELLKKGIRPAARELVALKRMLLCSKYSLSYFKRSRWSAWRQDERQYALTQPNPAYLASAFEDNCR
ncbi:hypothetical protein Emed_006500 [Eimeria media]